MIFWVLFLILSFQSTPPARGATALAEESAAVSQISIHAPREGGDSVVFALTFKLIHFNPRPPRGGRRCSAPYNGYPASISIHAPREGGDRNRWRISLFPGYFNPRPPRGGRQLLSCPMMHPIRFQSTPPARGATAAQLPDDASDQISIHAPREGGDSKDAQFYL